MGIVAKPHLAVLFVMVLTLGVSLGLPAEDVVDAVYDESEAVPLELITPVSPLSAKTTQAAQNSLDQTLGVSCRFSFARPSDTQSKGATNIRIALSLLCTLLC